MPRHCSGEPGRATPTGGFSVSACLGILPQRPTLDHPLPHLPAPLHALAQYLGPQTLIRSSPSALLGPPSLPSSPRLGACPFQAPPFPCPHMAPPKAMTGLSIFVSSLPHGISPLLVLLHCLMDPGSIILRFPSPPPPNPDPPLPGSGRSLPYPSCVPALAPHPVTCPKPVPPHMPGTVLFLRPAGVHSPPPHAAERCR